MDVTKRTYMVFIGACITGLIIITLPLIMGGNVPENWLLSARYTARFAFVLFLVPFVLPKWIARFGDASIRDSLLAFATAHTVHLGVLITYIP